MPPESEWGRLNAGQTYGILTVDIDRALACAGLGIHEAILLQYLREHSWGVTRRKGGRANRWPEAVPASVNISQLADRLKVPRQRLQDAKRRLLASRMIVESPAGLMVNKRADEWLDPADPTRPRLSPAMLTYAASAIKFDRPQPGPEGDEEEGQDERKTVHSSHSSTERKTVHPVNEKPFTPCTLERSPLNEKPFTPERSSVHPDTYRPRARLDPTGLDPTGSERTQRVRACAADGDDDDASIPNGPSPEPERREAVRFVADLTAGALEGWASAACRVYPAPWVRALVERKCIGGRGVPRAELLNSILQRWTREGQCEYIDAPAPLVPLRATGTGGAAPRPSHRRPDFRAMFDDAGDRDEEIAGGR